MDLLYSSFFCRKSRITFTRSSLAPTSTAPKTFSSFSGRSSYLTGNLSQVTGNRLISQVICPTWSCRCLFSRIDENSPLWEVSPIDLLTETFEIVLTMEGTTPETGNNIQVQPIMSGTKFRKCSNFVFNNNNNIIITMIIII